MFIFPSSHTVVIKQFNSLVLSVKWLQHSPACDHVPVSIVFMTWWHCCASVNVWISTPAFFHALTREVLSTVFSVHEVGIILRVCSILPALIRSKKYINNQQNAFNIYQGCFVQNAVYLLCLWWLSLMGQRKLLTIWQEIHRVIFLD